jgi:hypothetical protein
VKGWIIEKYRVKGRKSSLRKYQWKRKGASRYLDYYGKVGANNWKGTG